ncbi:cell division protein FtsK [Mesobacillus subterraneus]|uniref:cell division protein FtsK n=1 Tax=Mesobacillus subterraneus TaxID=285983 RepID=UPI001CFE55B5|nr:cell division protein FtsK [Mesobacillus subterraneus]WLR57366.1 cell division protein FtsK [Mesobacillus subterraneus]
MKLFKRVSDFFGFTKLKEKLFYADNGEITESDREYINSIKGQNPFGIIAMFIGGVSFAFGPIYVALPIITIIFCFLTYGTFDKEKEDNPWTFIMGFCLALIGLFMNLGGVIHELIV